MPLCNHRSLIGKRIFINHLALGPVLTATLSESEYIGSGIIISGRDEKVWGRKSLYGLQRRSLGRETAVHLKLKPLCELIGKFWCSRRRKCSAGKNL